MKAFLILILSFLFALATFGQDYPDSARPDDSVGRGFTNKAEAKNLTINGLKEGKWMERLDGFLRVITDTTNFKVLLDTIHNEVNPFGVNFYCLSVYKAGKYNGIIRWYGIDWKIWCEYPYINGKLNGIYKRYYKNGNVEIESPYLNGIANGVAKTYYVDGKMKQEILSVKGKTKRIKYYDQNGNQIINGVFKNYDENGKLTYETTIKNGKEKRTKFYNPYP